MPPASYTPPLACLPKPIVLVTNPPTDSWTTTKVHGKKKDRHHRLLRQNQFQVIYKFSFANIALIKCSIRGNNSTKYDYRGNLIINWLVNFPRTVSAHPTPPLPASLFPRKYTLKWFTLSTAAVCTTPLQLFETSTSVGKAVDIRILLLWEAQKDSYVCFTEACSGSTATNTLKASHQESAKETWWEKVSRVVARGAFFMLLGTAPPHHSYRFPISGNLYSQFDIQLLVYVGTERRLYITYILFHATWFLHLAKVCTGCGWCRCWFLLSRHAWVFQRIAYYYLSSFVFTLVWAKNLQKSWQLHWVYNFLSTCTPK